MPMYGNLGASDGDKSFWKKLLSEPNHVRDVCEKRSLRFHLTSAADFTAFGKAIAQHLPKVEFLDSVDADQPPEQE